MFLRGSAVAVGGIFASLGGAIVSLCRASQRGLQAGTRRPFPLLRRLECRIRRLLPSVGVAGTPAGGEICSPPAEVAHALRGEARGLRGDRARIDRGVHPTTIPRFPGVVSAARANAQPWRLAAERAIVLASVVALRRGTLGRCVAAAVLLAEAGRRRAGGAALFPAGSALWTPLWPADRGVCSWLVVASRLLRSGVPHRGGRLKVAAHPVSRLRAGQPLT